MPGDITDVYAGDKLDPALIDGSGDPKRESSARAHDVELPPVYNGTTVHQSEWLDHDLPLPNEEELRTLRRVSEKIPIKAYTIAFVELVERLSYYGTTQVCEQRLTAFHQLTQPGLCQLHSAAQPWHCHRKGVGSELRRCSTGRFEFRPTGFYGTDYLQSGEIYQRQSSSPR